MVRLSLTIFSLLPKYRGAACLQAAILNGDKETGVTIMRMEAGLDTGPILEQFTISLHGTETLEDLHDAVAALANKVLPTALKDYLVGKLVARAQDDTLASYYRTVKKENGRLDFQKSAIELERQIRAYTPWPGSFALTEDDKMIKIVKVSSEIEKSEGKIPGELFMTDKKLCLASADGALQITELQLAGGRVMSVKDFLSGHQDFIGKKLK
ncbi:MAG: methionyl-tRNA formyltransferase [Candidatus Falkowbacteria bacterium]|nr:methionyl-tRNA formyltransferase [Candidatus Falkowbacteria bacterium]